MQGGKLQKKTATFPKVRRCGLDQTIGVNPGINTPQRALHYTHSRTGHMEGLSNIWDRPPKRINFKNNLQIFNFSCISTIQSFSALACVLWVLVSKVVLVHSKRSGAWLPTGKEVPGRKFLEGSAEPGNSSRSSFSCPHQPAPVDQSGRVNGNSVIYERKYLKIFKK